MLNPITEHHKVKRPTMIPRVKVPGNRGTEVIMVSTDFNSVEPEPDPEPIREPITVTMAAKWADLNNYKVCNLWG